VNHDNVDSKFEVLIGEHKSMKHIEEEVLIKADEHSHSFSDVNIQEEDRYIEDNHAYVPQQSKEEEPVGFNYLIKNETPCKKEEIPFKTLEVDLSICEDDLTFVLKAGDNGFEKGAQLYFSYEKQPNEYFTSYYLFCNPNNIYNFAKINMNLSKEEEETYCKFKEENMSYIKHVFGESNYNNKEFKIFTDRINIKLLKFVKICTFSQKDYPLTTILKPKVLEIEQRAIEKAISHLQLTLQAYPTTLEQDLEEIRTEAKGYKYHLALTYRSENKKWIVNQIKCLRILLEIIKRLKDKVDFAHAIERVDEIESEEDVRMNRKILEEYLEQLKLHYSGFPNN